MNGNPRSLQTDTTAAWEFLARQLQEVWKFSAPAGSGRGEGGGERQTQEQVSGPPAFQALLPTTLGCCSLTKKGKQGSLWGQSPCQGATPHSPP